MADRRRPRRAREEEKEESGSTNNCAVAATTTTKKEDEEPDKKRRRIDSDSDSDNKDRERDVERVWMLCRSTGLSHEITRHELEACITNDDAFLPNYAIDDPRCAILCSHPGDGDPVFCATHTIRGSSVFDRCNADEPCIDPGEAVLCVESKITYNLGAIAQYIQHSVNFIVGHASSSSGWIK